MGFMIAGFKENVPFVVNDIPETVVTETLKFETSV